jgi:hypothetical protein
LDSFPLGSQQAVVSRAAAMRDGLLIPQISAKNFDN